MSLKCFLSPRISFFIFFHEDSILYVPLCLLCLLISCEYHRYLVTRCKINTKRCLHFSQYFWTDFFLSMNIQIGETRIAWNMFVTTGVIFVNLVYRIIYVQISPIDFKEPLFKYYRKHRVNWWCFMGLLGARVLFWTYFF